MIITLQVDSSVLATQDSRQQTNRPGTGTLKLTLKQAAACPCLLYACKSLLLIKSSVWI